MKGIAKKTFLVYFLFLLTTISDNSGLTTTGPLLAENEPVRPVAAETIAQPALPELRKPEAEKANVPAVSIDKPQTASAESPTEIAGITPAMIEIPAIGEQAKVIEVGLTEDGAMATPAGIREIGWFAPGTKPGDPGNAVMAGHVDGLTDPGTFYNLKELEAGDEIVITGTDGTKLMFTVTDKQSYTPEEAPLNRIFGSHDKARLNLITCTGDYNERAGYYEERLVVYTELTEVS